MFKIPMPKVPTDDEMIEVATRWWEHHKQINFGDWNQSLKDNTFEFRLCTLPKELVEKVIGLMDGKKEFYPSVVKEYGELITPLLKELNCENKFFIKLITRSPKDSLADLDNYTKPKALASIEESLGAMFNSMRVFEDLCLLRYINKVTIVVRPYVDFEAYEEFRVYIEERKIVGISQYYYQGEFKELTPEYITNVKMTIEQMVTDIALPSITLNDFVIDVVMGNDKRKTVFLEANPYGLSDPCLFNNYKAFEQSHGCLRYMKNDLIVEV